MGEAQTPIKWTGIDSNTSMDWSYFWNSVATAWLRWCFKAGLFRLYLPCPLTGRPYLICSKTKVAPVNTQYITRLKLMAAWLLATLLDICPQFCLQSPEHSLLWSDSRNVLCLLKSVPAKLMVFEANRVSDIISTLSSDAGNMYPRHRILPTARPGACQPEN